MKARADLAEKHRTDISALEIDIDVAATTCGNSRLQPIVVFGLVERLTQFLRPEHLEVGRGRRLYLDFGPRGSSFAVRSLQSARS